MNGQRVIVRAFGNKPLVRRVWETTPEKVYICGEENFEQLASGQQGLPPIGFPRDDVFCYDEAMLNVLLQGYESDPSTWDLLILWEGGPE